jgi:hypothetical protein
MEGNPTRTCAEPGCSSPSAERPTCGRPPNYCVDHQPPPGHSRSARRGTPQYEARMKRDREKRGFLSTCSACGKERPVGKAGWRGVCSECRVTRALVAVCREAVSVVALEVRTAWREPRPCYKCGTPVLAWKQICDACRERTRQEQRRACTVRNHTRRRLARHGVDHEPYGDIRKIWRESDGRCSYCGRLTVLGMNGDVPNGACLDHVVPISRGGPDAGWNVTLACHSCNMRKKTAGVDWIIEELVPEVAA